MWGNRKKTNKSPFFSFQSILDTIRHGQIPKIKLSPSVLNNLGGSAKKKKN